MIKMPKKSQYVKFKNYEKQIKSPFSIYNKYKNMSPVIILMN